jgi:ABC-2 type transport system permease protein
MTKLLTIEWLKIRTFRTFWILTGFFAVLLPLWNYGIAHGIVKLGGKELNLVSQAYSFPFVWQNMGFWTSLFVVFISILTIILTTNEYQYRTNRQNVIDGWTRLQFYHAKWQLVLSLSILTVVYVFIAGFTFGIAYGSMNEFPGHIESLFYTWVLALNYYSFSLLLSLLFKRSGITIGMFFLYCMFIETFLSKFINWALETKAGNYLPLQSSDELLPFPLLEVIKTIAKMNEPINNTLFVAASFIWIIVYYFAGRVRLMKSDW